jgi:hypothetical protein
LENTTLNCERRRRVGANVHQAHLSAARQTLHSCPPAPRSPERSSHGSQKSVPRLWWRRTAGILEKRWAARVHGERPGRSAPTERISSEIDLRRAMASLV